jgi:hypothetical protein
MLAMLLLILSIMLSGLSGQEPTFSAAGPNASTSIVTLLRQLKSGDTTALKRFWDAVHQNSAPLIQAVPGANGFGLVTFLWQGNDQTRNVVIFDGVAGFDAKEQMLHLETSDVWYKTYRVRNDARFAYNLLPNDSLQPFDQVKGNEAMRDRLAMLKIDPLNPHRCPTTFGAYRAESSYVELPGAPHIAPNLPVAESGEAR